MDEELLAEARDAARRMSAVQRQLDLAKADYNDAIRRMHIAGASMKEIAEAPDISHQRVHQVVESAGGSREWRVDAKPGASMTCSFCGRDRSDVARLVAGPGVFICDRCGQNARDTLVSTGPAAAEGRLFDPVSTSSTECSFCKQRAGKRNPVAIGSRDTGICSRCLEFMAEALDDIST